MSAFTLLGSLRDQQNILVEALTDDELMEQMRQSEPYKVLILYAAEHQAALAKISQGSTATLLDVCARLNELDEVQRAHTAKHRAFFFLFDYSSRLYRVAQKLLSEV